MKSEPGATMCGLILDRGLLMTELWSGCFSINASPRFLIGSEFEFRIGEATSR